MPRAAEFLGRQFSSHWSARSRRADSRPGPGQSPEGAFKVPTLRNVALSAPYMHNGRFAKLEEVIDFYSKGGGHQFTNQSDAIDDKIGEFEITAEETADLVAFLNV